MRCGAVASRRRATACPTNPLPPRIITVRSRSSMASLDGFDLPCGEPPPFPLGEASQTYRSVGHAVQPLHLESERFGEPPHDALPAFGRSEEHTSELQSHSE